ncbi:hypothetical protein RvY_06079-2 [Ramazzottius varieornatus]|uniref:ER membrane protein complex subunit 1 n=1 Tax=Ramazzottius varieornatus TaxID=947166 RepID=A0A1D1UXB3_RAMVA|nr:hypothetical protein RvY_06079-2 [Ramazzottius varieornatus]
MDSQLRSLLNVISCLIVLCSLAKVIQAIHEDQIGLHDWSLQFIGRPIEVLLSASQSGASRSLVYTYTEQNVLAAIDVNYGEIAWRQVFENNANGTISSAVTVGEEICVLLNRGRSLRCYDSLTGAFKWEKWFGGKSGNSGSCVGITKTTESPKDANRIVCANSDGMYAVNTKTKNTLWDVRSPNILKRYAFASHSGELVVVGINQDKLTIKRLSSETGEAKENDIERSVSIDPLRSECRLVQPASQVSPFVICYNAAQRQLLSQSSGESSREPHLISVHELGEFPVEGKNVSLQNLETDGLFSLSAGGVSLLLQIHPNGEIKLVQRFVGSVTSCSGTEVLALEVANKRATLGTAAFDSRGFTTVSLTSEPFSFPSAYGNAQRAVFIPRKDSSCAKPSVLFWSDSDVIGYFTQGKILWQRDEALSTIETAAIVDLPISDIEALVEQEFEEKGSFIVRFTKRLLSQALQLKKFAEVIVRRLQAGLRTGKFFQKDQLERDYFNTHKIIVGITGKGKIVGMDSRNGNILYSLQAENLVSPKDRPVQFYLQRTGAHAPFPSQAVIVGVDKTGDGVLFFFDCVTGEELGPAVRMNRPILQSGLIPVMTNDHLEAIFVLDEDLNVEIHPALDSAETAEFLTRTLHIFYTDPRTGVTRGFRVKRMNQGWKAVELWNSTLVSHGESVVAVAPKRPHDAVHSQGKVLADRRVLYKYINPNLVAVVVEGLDDVKKPYLKMVGMDGITGRVLISQTYRRARGPCQLIHAENWLMLSYWNEKVRQSEINVVEMYRGFDKPNKTYFSSLESHEKPNISTASFRLPGFVDAMKDSVTVEGITYKDIIVALSSGSIMRIPKFLLDPRRPMIPTQAEREEGLIPYAPELPMVTENIINYYKKAYRIRGMVTEVAGLESLSLVFAFGLDLCFTRVTPSALFDVLSDSFDYWILSVVMLVLTVASVIVRNLANAKALKHAWK